nr:MAG TPA: hypothetical protein [Caudoviricetes sp.]
MSDPIPEKLPPPSFAQASEGKSGLSSTAPARRLRVLFGGPALRTSARLRRARHFEKGTVYE